MLKGSWSLFTHVVIILSIQLKTNKPYCPSAWNWSHELVPHTLVWDWLPSITCPVVRALKQTQAAGGDGPPPAHVMLSHLNYVSSTDRCSAAGCSPCDDRGENSRHFKRFSPGTVTPRRAEPGATTVCLQRDPQLFESVCLKKKLQIIYTDLQNTYLDIRD